MERQHYIEKKLSSTPELFDLYSRLPLLGNLQIDKIDQFSKFQVKINNPGLKHLTIGEYVGEKGEKQKDLPEYVINEVLKLRNLKTINFFSNFVYIKT